MTSNGSLLRANPGHLGAMPATANTALWGLPSSRHEAACASGSVAVLSAVADLRSAAYDCGSAATVVSVVVGAVQTDGS